MTGCRSLIDAKIPRSKAIDRAESRAGQGLTIGAMADDRLRWINLDLVLNQPATTGALDSHGLPSRC
jgi:hypothetical protein